jgi:Peptidase family C25
MPAAPVIKVIVTHSSAGRAKYGTTTWNTITRAVRALVSADKQRGITTRLVALDSARALKPVGATRVATPGDVTDIKNAIDHIVTAWRPAYIVLLGGPDLIQTVSLVNPLWTGDPDDDPDQFIPSDLPYACDGALSFSPSDYRGPTRVVGRIPDLVGDNDPTALLTQLDVAAKGVSLTRLSPEPVFAVSAKVWQRSTALSIKSLPDVTATVLTSPPAGPPWAKTQISPVVHFVNCHGGDFDPAWYGQVTPTNWNLPVAISAAGLPGLVSPGTVVAAECCYGASHWSPSVAHGQPSVAMTYLLNGAVGVFGASTVAYGPATTNNYADVLCQRFVAEVLAGASLGRAVLAARQSYVQSQGFLDPTDLKTLAQFTLFGDPSTVALKAPAAAPKATAHAASKAAPKGRRRVGAPTLTADVNQRRRQLAIVGSALAQSSLACTTPTTRRPALDAGTLSSLIARDVAGATIRTFEASSPSDTPAHGPMPRASVAFLPTPGTGPSPLVIVRDSGSGTPDVRVVVRR